MRAHRMWLAIQSRLRAERGASLIEYAFLVALIALVCIAAVVLLGEETSERISTVAESVSAAK